MATRIRCPIEDCHQIVFGPATAKSKNDFTTSGDCLVVVAEDIAAAADGVGFVKVPQLLVDKAAVLVEAGEKAYRDDEAETFTNIATGACRGHFNEGAAASASTAEIYFDGALWGS